MTVNVDIKMNRAAVRDMVLDELAAARARRAKYGDGPQVFPDGTKLHVAIEGHIIATATHAADSVWEVRPRNHHAFTVHDQFAAHDALTALGHMYLAGMARTAAAAAP
ncbi:hypothetical protein [Mycobacteroides abscessus]|uniref:hypothetical protein n=1 Tax=Mycobacteroides abscessus TaxID=36809 RepID=UPI000926B338|nr:hypothetical protein [Mycobacteroides abscessus]SHP52709.1 Uncharacterised protein [Mycobacteroides abscessus subsp. abscessus]